MAERLRAVSPAVVAPQESTRVGPVRRREVGRISKVSARREEGLKLPSPPQGASWDRPPQATGKRESEWTQTTCIVLFLSLVFLLLVYTEHF